MVKITLENGAVLEGSVEELRQMGVKFPEQSKPLVAGDYAKIVSATNFHCLTDGDIVEVIGGARYLIGGRQVRRLSDNKDQYVPAEQLIRATDEEVAEAKKHAQPETITHEGVEYKRVDRKAREGDVVVVRETEDCDLTVGKAYVVTENLGDSDAGVIDDIGENNAVLNNSEKFDVYEPTVAKPAPLQVGDYAKVVEEGSHSASYGELVKVIEDDKDAQPYFCENIEGKGVGYFYPKELTRATDEEVAEAKRNQAEKAVADKWADIGREAAEFKKGDIVRVVAGSVYSAGTIGEVTELLNSGGLFRVEADGRLYGNFHDSDDVELITPVEHRFDKPGGDSE